MNYPKFRTLDDLLYTAKTYFEDWPQHTYFYGRVYGRVYIVYPDGRYTEIAED